MSIEIANDIQIIKNALSMMPKVYRKYYSNVELVSKILLTGTSHSGSGSSYEKCTELGIKPNGHKLPSWEEIKELIK